MPSYGTEVRSAAQIEAAAQAAIARHSHYYTDVAGWLIRAEANRYSSCVLDVNGREDYYVSDPRIELFAFPVLRFTPCGATLKDIWSSAKQRWVDLRPGAKQWASRTGTEAIEQLRERRRRQVWVISRQQRRAEDDMAVCDALLENNCNHPLAP